MGKLAAAVTWARDQLDGAGINAATEPADVNLPGVIVSPGVATWRLGEDALEVELDLLLVARQVRALDALDQLDDLLEAVSAVLPIGEVHAVMVSLTGSQAADPLPALRTSCTVLSD